MNGKSAFRCDTLGDPPQLGYFPAGEEEEVLPVAFVGFIWIPAFLALERDVQKPCDQKRIPISRGQEIWLTLP